MVNFDGLASFNDVVVRDDVTIGGNSKTAARGYRDYPIWN